MPAHHGHDGQGGGRPPGSPNKATSKAREAIASFVDGNAHRLSSWLDAIAAENPRAAFDCFMSVVEYHIPKLQRQEITGKDGERLQINVVAGFSKPMIDAEFKEITVELPKIGSSEKPQQNDE